MGKLIIGDYMKKKKRKKKNNANSKIILLIILFLLVFSCFEINGDIRLGNILNDILFIPSRMIKKNELLDSINSEIKKENEELKGLMNIDYSLAEFVPVYAAIIERNNSFWLDELTINKGKNDGIQNGDAVITENGLVGVVKSTGFITSKIKLITGLDKQIQVNINDKYKILSVKNNKIFVRGINNEDNIKENDMVLTSGLQDSLPKGILIGKIKKINREKDNVGLIAEIELNLDINDLRFVAILKRIDK